MKQRSALGVLCDSIMLKENFHKTVIRPTMLCGTKCWATYTQNECKDHILCDCHILQAKHNLYVIESQFLVRSRSTTNCIIEDKGLLKNCSRKAKTTHPDTCSILVNLSRVNESRYLLDTSQYIKTWVN